MFSNHQIGDCDDNLSVSWILLFQLTEWINVSSQGKTSFCFASASLRSSDGMAENQDSRS